MKGMESTDYFQCDRCHLECQIDSVATEPTVVLLLVRHCPDSKGVAIFGKVIRFQERRGSL